MKIMEYKAVARRVRVQPRKVRLIADEVRGKSASQMADVLKFHSSKSARELRKVLVSAMANAAEQNGVNVETLTVSEIQVNEGPIFKRMRPRAMGRGNRIEKKTSHIMVVVEESEAKATVKPHGTKAKKRPTLSGGPKGKKPKKAEEAAAAMPEVSADAIAAADSDGDGVLTVAEYEALASQ